MLSFNLILIALPLTHALVLQKLHEYDDHDHSHNVRISLPSQTWYHPQDHPVHALFKRAAEANGTSYAPVGSPAWSAGFPAPGLTLPDPKTLPAPWVNALNSAIAAGKIPNISVSSNTPGTNPVYPVGFNPNSPQVCSATYKCRIPGDIWDSPDGVFASAFDDGPTPSTTQLLQFLTSKNKTTTHFMIGYNIIYYPSQFLAAFQSDHDIAVHTWTHPYMTTLNNLDVLGELGWTMQLIANSTGGRLPKFWRPPYGDSDVRVTAIAREVFNLQTVVWNQDSADWHQTTTPPIQASLTQFLTGPKSPGLIVLEHELTDVTVGGFINSYDMINSNGWNFQSLAQVIGGGRSYLNAQNSSSNDVVQTPIVSSSSSTTSTSTISTSISGTSTTAAVIATSSSKQGSSATNLWTTCPSTTLLLVTLFSVAVLCS
ncbi:glycoside hydrolase/deacetylase [Phlegmacium glaucopus]|nr:glycoside hydrolase/deacetylase [Phlegmacium glaucopus]